MLGLSGTFDAIHQIVQNDLREAFLHQACPLHLLPSAITINNGRRADEAMFQMLPQALEQMRMGDLNVTMVAPEAIESRFDFEVTVLLEQEKLAVIVLSNPNRLDQNWVTDFMCEYSAAIEDVLNSQTT